MKTKKLIYIYIFALFTVISTAVYAQSDNAVDFYNTGKSAETGGDFYTAVEMYKSALELNNKYFDAVRGLAHAYYGLDEFDEALKYVEDAEKLDSANTDLMNLKARIFLNTGRFEEAGIIFKSVLEIEENNIESEFGLAELDIASGRINTAAGRYENVLLVSPESRKALLALVMINDNNGNTAGAEYFLKQALVYYSENPYVRYIAADHYYRTGNTNEALFHLKTALFLQDDFLEASVLLCRIYMGEGNYPGIIDVIENIIPDHETEPALWYLLGRAYENTDDFETAVMCYSRAINIRPDEDLSRIALENVIITELPMDSRLREQYSEHHIDLGRKNEARNMLDKALCEYRRALIINPYSVDARLLYGEIFKRKGFTERYLLILNALVGEGLETVDIIDEIEIQSSMLSQTVSERWDSDQFSVKKEANKIALFFSDKGMTHPEGEYILSEYIEYLLLGYENIEIKSNGISDEFAYCYRTAREHDSDYFIIFKCIEDERAVSIQAEIFLSSTGNRLKTINVMRTGNQMLPEAGKALTKEIHSILPVYGMILNRKFDEIFVSLGEKDGIMTGDELLIIKKGAIERAKDNFDLVYDEQAVIGTYRVTASDELVSDGSISVRGFFDMVNPGDFIMKIPEQEEEPSPEDDSSAQLFYTGNLFNSISNIR